MKNTKLQTCYTFKIKTTYSEYVFNTILYGFNKKQTP